MTSYLRCSGISSHLLHTDQDELPPTRGGSQQTWTHDLGPSLLATTPPRRGNGEGCSPPPLWPPHRRGREDLPSRVTYITKKSFD